MTGRAYGTNHMKEYRVYLEDREDVYTVLVPAYTEAEAREYVKGNGEIIAVKDVTGNYPIDENRLGEVLRAGGIGQGEADIILRALYTVGITQ